MTKNKRVKKGLLIAATSAFGLLIIGGISELFSNGDSGLTPIVIGFGGISSCLLFWRSRIYAQAPYSRSK